VDVYVRLPPGIEPEVTSSVPAPGSSILEVYAGTGRIAEAPAGHGFDAVAEDRSPEILAHIRLAGTVCQPVEGLDLGRRFDAVVFANHMINGRKRGVVRGSARYLSQTCRWLADTGCAPIERRPPAWFDQPEAFERQLGDLDVQLKEIDRPAEDLVAGTFIYTVADGRQWTHRVTSRRLDNAKFTRELAAAGL